MDQITIVLTPFNCFEYKQNIFLLLHSKGLYRITMGTKVEFTLANKK